MHNCKAALFITSLAFQKQAKELKLESPKAGRVLGEEAEQPPTGAPVGAELEALAGCSGQVSLH